MREEEGEGDIEVCVCVIERDWLGSIFVCSKFMLITRTEPNKLCLNLIVLESWSQHEAIPYLLWASTNDVTTFKDSRKIF